MDPYKVLTFYLGIVLFMLILTFSSWVFNKAFSLVCAFLIDAHNETENVEALEGGLLHQCPITACIYVVLHWFS